MIVLLLQRVVLYLGKAVYQLDLCLLSWLSWEQVSTDSGSVQADYRLHILDL